MYRHFLYSESQALRSTRGREAHTHIPYLAPTRNSRHRGVTPTREAMTYSWKVAHLTSLRPIFLLLTSMRHLKQVPYKKQDRRCDLPHTPTSHSCAFALLSLTLIRSQHIMSSGAMQSNVGNPQVYNDADQRSERLTSNAYGALSNECTPGTLRQTAAPMSSARRQRWSKARRTRTIFMTLSE